MTKPLAGRVTLISPHTNENPTTVPFLQAVGDRLRSQGVEVEEIIRTDMMERGWAVTKKLREYRFHEQGTAQGRRIQRLVEGSDGGELVGAVLSLEDSIWRCGRITEALERRESVAEIHAYSLAARDEGLIERDDWKALGKTGIMIPKAGHVLTAIGKDVLELMGELGAGKDDSDMLGTLLCGESASRMRETLGRLLESIRGSASGRVHVFELPSHVLNLDEEHPAHELYYMPYRNGFGEALIGLRPENSYFERSYYAVERIGEGFDGKAVELAAKTIASAR